MLQQVVETEEKIDQETRTFKEDNDIIQDLGLMKNVLKME